jgi:hypothetical protein
VKRAHPAIILLVVAALAYGLLIPQLGFYWDDLPMSWVRYQLGPQAMAQYFSTNRPVWGLLYQVTTRLLPHVPIYWQIFALFWRWLGGVVLWAIIRKLWPERSHLALGVSLFFLLYPGFNQQWGSYLYSHFFIVIFFYLSSLYLMLRGGWRNTIPALLLSALNLWMMEYFFVLELARPFVIWISLHDESISPRQRFRRTFNLWAPYLAVFILAVLSRLFVFNNQIYGFGIENELRTEPPNAVIILMQNILTSLWTVSAVAWAQIFQIPNPISAGPRTSALYAAVTLVTFGIVYFYIRRIQNTKPAASQRDDSVETISKFSTTNRRQIGWIFGLGLVMLMLGGPPFWLTGVPVSLGFPANRANLSFMLGVSLVLAGVLELIQMKTRIVILAVLVALAAGRQFLWANDFRRDWSAHKNFFWQMTWRAPGLAPDTLVLTNEELTYYADNSMSAALNWIYAPDNHTGRVDYLLFYPTNRIGAGLPSLQPNVKVNYSYLAGEFKGSTSQSVVFYYAPPGCLRLLDPEIDPYNHLIPADSLLREAAFISSTTPILKEATARMPDVYGPEPVHGWCYYFEQADLARQQKDWKKISALGDQALALHDYPNDPLERFVFIEGYAHVGEWPQAEELTMISYRVSKDFVGPLLCRLWDRIDRETEAGAEKPAVIEEIKTKLACST